MIVATIEYFWAYVQRNSAKEEHNQQFYFLKTLVDETLKIF